MPETALTHPYHELPNELVDKVIGFLPHYRFIGENSVHTVCHTWNDLIHNAPNLRNKRNKSQIIRSVRTEEDARLSLSNGAIFDEIRFDKLMRLSLKVTKVRELVLPLLNFSDLLEASKDDINITRHIIESEGKSLNVGQLTTLIGYHEILANEYLDTKPDLFLVTACNLSVHINIAKRILAMPGFSPAARYSICLKHDQLIDENLPLVAEVLHQLNDDDELYYFARMHAHRRKVADFIMDKFADKCSEDPLLCAIMAVHHLDVAQHLFSNKKLCKKLDSAEYLRDILNAHFEICLMIMNNPELIDKFVYEDVAFIMFIMHFPRSRAFMDSDKFKLRPSFLDTYGSVLELPRVRKVISEEKNHDIALTSYDLKLAFAYDFLENPGAFEIHLDQPQPNFILIEIFHEMKLCDLKAKRSLIMNILQDDSIRVILPCDVIHIFARRLQFVREYIAGDEKLIKQILKGKFSNYHDVNHEQFLYACPNIERKILGTPSLRNLLNDKQIEVSSNRQYINEHLKDLFTDATAIASQEITIKRAKQS